MSYAFFGTPPPPPPRPNKMLECGMSGLQAALQEAEKEKEFSKDASSQLEAATARIAELEVALQAAGGQEAAGIRSDPLPS